MIDNGTFYEDKEAVWIDPIFRNPTPCPTAIGSTGTSFYGTITPNGPCIRDIIPEDERNGWLQEQMNISYREDRAYQSQQNSHNELIFKYVAIIIAGIVILTGLILSRF
jgi:hypothetical protein